MDGGRDPNESKRMHFSTCEHLPAHILQVSEQPETWSKGWLWETEDKQDNQDLWERTWAESYDVMCYPEATCCGKILKATIPDVKKKKEE